MDSYETELKPRKRNVFVTQFSNECEDVNEYRIVEESPNELLQTGIKTLPSTLLIKQATESDKLEEEFQNKIKEYHANMLACKKREEMLSKRQQQIQERVNKFDMFIKETEGKRRRALQKYHKEKQLKELKGRELENHKQELKKLQQRQKHLRKKVEAFSVYQKYLMKVVEISPGDYFDNTSDSALLDIMARHKTLDSTFQILSTAMNRKADEIKVYQQAIQQVKLQYSQQVLIDTSEIAKLQAQLEDLKHSNANFEHVLETSEEIYRQQRTSLGQVKLAVLNLAEKCVRKHCPPLVSLDVFEMLTAIQEFIREHQDICVMARNMKTPELDIKSSGENKTKLNFCEDYGSSSINVTQPEEFF